LSDSNFLGTIYYVSGGHPTIGSGSGINLINSGSGYSGRAADGSETDNIDQHLFNIYGTHLSAQSQSGLHGLSGFFSTGSGVDYSEKINNTASGWPIVDSYICNTQKVYQVTGFYLFNSGKYLNDLPTISFSGTHHSDCTQLQTATASTIVSGQSDFSQGSGSITGIEILSVGENYTGLDDLSENPQLFFSGVGTGANIDPVMISYDKHFFETWDLKTGYLPDQITSFSGTSYSGTDHDTVTRYTDSNYRDGINLFSSDKNSLFIEVDNVPYFDTGQVVARLRVTGQGFDFSEYITGQK